MPAIDTLIAFFGVAVLLALSPGPDNLFVLVQSAQRGWRLGMCVVVGLCLGILVHTTAVALGLAAVLAAAGIYLGLGRVLSRETASWLCIVIAAPFAAAGFFSYNGMNMEQFIWAFIKSQILFAGARKYISEDPHYDAFHGKEREQW